MNNVYTGWEMYAIGGSANPTINSQGNVFIASGDNSTKEVSSFVKFSTSYFSSSIPVFPYKHAMSTISLTFHA